jgi:hypothetical protein
MKKVIALEVTAQTGQVEQSVGNIRKELKGAQRELIAAQATFGTYSKEALSAAKRVAELKDQIADANETAALFDPGNKFAAFSNALSAVAGGFAAVQGAQALLGSESEDLAKTLAKVQGALALSQGLSQIKDMGKNFGEVSAVIKGPVIKAFTTLRGAIIATGIGALAIGITLLIANFDKVKDAVMKLIPGLSTFTKTIGNIITAVTDFVGITSEAERGLDKLRSANERFQEDSENRIRVLQAMGGKEREIYQERVQQTEGELNVLRNALKVKGKLSDEELKRFRELKTQMQVLQIDENKRNDENQKKEKDKKDAEAKAQNDKATADAKAAADKRAADAKQAADEAKRKKDEAEKQRQQELEQRQKLEEELRRERMTEADRELADVQAQYNQRVMLAKGNADLLVQIERSRDEQIRAIRDKFNLDEDNRVIVEKKVVGQQIDLIKIRQAAEVADADLRAKLTQKFKEQKEQELQAAATIAGNLTQIFGQQTAVGKGFAIAEATINTYLGASKALTGIPKGNPVGAILAITQAAAIIAAGIRNVKAIASTKVPNAPGVNAASGSLANISVPAPIAPQAQTTQLDQSSINAVGNAAAGRAFVLNTDIQNNQERIARLNRAARIN